MREIRMTMAALAASMLLWGGVMGVATGCSNAQETVETENAAGKPVVAESLAQVAVRLPEAPRYTRFSPYSGSGELQPREDYGLLLPYVGGSVPTENYILDRLPLWGLVTRDGQIVTDPVYASIDTYGPYLLLYRGMSPEEARYQKLMAENEEQTADGGNADRDSEARSGADAAATEDFTLRYDRDTDEAEEPEAEEAAPYTVTLAAMDGSWVQEANDWDHSLLLEDGRLAIARTDGSVDILNSRGEVEVRFPRSALMPYLGVDYAWIGAMGDNETGGELVYAGGPLAVCFYDWDAEYGNGWRYDCFLDIDTGKVTGTPPENWNPEDGWGDWEETPEFDDYNYPSRLSDAVTGETFYCAGRLDASDHAEDLLDAEGNVLQNDCFTESSLLWEPIIADGLMGIIRNGAFQYRKIDSGRVVFSYPIQNVEG